MRDQALSAALVRYRRLVRLMTEPASDRRTLRSRVLSQRICRFLESSTPGQMERYYSAVRAIVIESPRPMSFDDEAIEP